MVTKTRVRKIAAPAAPAPRPTYTAEVAGDKILERIVENAKMIVRVTVPDLDKWAKRFSEDPADALSWSQNVFKQAADLSVAKLVLAIVDHCVADADEIYGGHSNLFVAQSVYRRLRDEVMRNARWPSHSTSAPSNEIDLCLMAARAETVVRIEELAQHYGLAL